MREIRGHHNSLHCCCMTVQTSRYAGRQKNPQHSKKIQAFVQNTLNILSLPSYTSVDTVQGNAALQHQTLMASPHRAWAACRVHTCPGILQRLPRTPGIPSHTPLAPPGFASNKTAFADPCSTPKHPERAAALKLSVDRLSRHSQSSQNSSRDSSPQELLWLPSLVLLHQPQPGKGCCMLEAPGWLLTLVSPFHVLFPMTTNLQGPDLQGMAGVLSSPSWSLKDGLALLAQQAPHCTPVQTLLPPAALPSLKPGIPSPNWSLPGPLLTYRTKISLQLPWQLLWSTFAVTREKPAFDI